MMEIGRPAFPWTVQMWEPVINSRRNPSSLKVKESSVIDSRRIQNSGRRWEENMRAAEEAQNLKACLSETWKLENLKAGLSETWKLWNLKTWKPEGLFIKKWHFNHSIEPSHLQTHGCLMQNLGGKPLVWFYSVGENHLLTDWLSHWYDMGRFWDTRMKLKYLIDWRSPVLLLRLLAFFLLFATPPFPFWAQMHTKQQHLMRNTMFCKLAKLLTSVWPHCTVCQPREELLYSDDVLV